MSDIIHLLSDSVANKIAAGEVIQRPASAVKELLENAVDAGATVIKLIVKEAGKTLIQVNDNGCGMSETDARMCFERHATSKIKEAEDLFMIRTKGFRGEALASLAAVAQVELRTRRTGDELGTLICIEGTEITRQEAVNCPEGTSFMIKNLFFNIPARRNFLKPDSTETKHIIEEFQRVALAHPDIAFELHHNGMEIHHLIPGSFRQRIVQIFGAKYNENLVPLDEHTTILSVEGFIGKPDAARKTKGEQFFFINRRFIRNNYLHHAVTNAYDQLLPPGSFPSYFLFIDMDPSRIDINIHPTKTEVKFDDEKSIYAIIRAAVKHSLGQYSVSPVLDFEQENSMNIPYRSASAPLPSEPTITVNPDFNPFDTGQRSDRTERNQSFQNYFQKDSGSVLPYPLPKREDLRFPEQEENTADEGFILQVNKKYILSQSAGGFTITDQQPAHERVLYEKYLRALVQNQGTTQQDLFPQTIEFPADTAALLMDLLEDIRTVGFDIREFGKNTFVIHGIPTDLPLSNSKTMIEELLEQFKNFSNELKLDKRERLARSMARNFAVKPGRELSKPEMKQILNDLGSCSVKNMSPSGKPCRISFSEEELNSLFKNNRDR